MERIDTLWASGCSRALVLMASVVAPALVWAQVSLYNYSESVEPYIAITEADGGYSLGTPSWNPPFHNQRAWANNSFFEPDGQVGSYLSPAIGPGYEIGFDFRYNGDVFDRIGVAHGGWISFGKSSDGNRSVVIFTSDHSAGRPLSHSYWQPPPSTNRPDHDYQRNRVAGWGSSSLRMQDMSPLVPPGPVSSLRVATIGTAPNRVCVIQWKDFRHNYSADNYRINFQIRLNESDNSVEVRFGEMEWGWMEARPQIGLGGRTNEDFNNRVVVYGQPAFLYDWNNTVSGTVNTDAMIAIQPQPGQPNGSGVVPVVGRTFRWTPDACSAPAWPLEVVSIGLGRAELQWPAVLGAVTYDYVVTTTPDPNTPSPIAEGNVGEPYLIVEGLDTLTTYYFHVRTVCEDGSGPWGRATEIRSAGGAILECGAAPLEQYHCYAPVQQTTWYYTTSDDSSPIRILFTGGLFTSGARFRVFNGPDTMSTVLWDSNTGGVLIGQSFVTSGSSLTLKMNGHETAGCSNTDFLSPIQWTVGCKDCTDPLVSFALGDVDCDAREYYVDVNVFLMGSATELALENDLGAAALVVNTTGIHSVGPFPAGLPVTINAVNTANSLCNVLSAQLVNEPCPIQDCGPTWYEECLGRNEARAWLFHGDGAPVGVRFLPVYTGFDARIRSYDGPDELSPRFPDIGSFSGVNNEVRRSTNDDHQLLVTYTASQYEDYSCAVGNAPPLEFVVGCFDDCEQPAATFAYADCVEAGTFNVVVNVTGLGSENAVVITNDGGAPDISASEIGTYTVGPFASGSVVRLHVEGANELCTWSSPLMSRSCLDVSMEELATDQLRIYPNPSDGNFRVMLPEAFSGRSELHVMDLAGRMVEEQVLNGSSEVVLSLERLPSGLYTVVVQGPVQRYTTKISIQH